MTSADFSQQTFYDHASYSMFLHLCETSRGKVNYFHSMNPHHLHYVVCVVFGLRSVLQTHPNEYA